MIEEKCSKKRASEGEGKKGERVGEQRREGGNCKLENERIEKEGRESRNAKEIRRAERESWGGRKLKRKSESEKRARVGTHREGRV